MLYCLPQELQVTLISPERIFKCFLKYPASENIRGQCSQANGINAPWRLFIPINRDLTNLILVNHTRLVQNIFIIAFFKGIDHFTLDENNEIPRFEKANLLSFSVQLQISRVISQLIPWVGYLVARCVQLHLKSW